MTEDDCHSESFPPLDSVATATDALTSSRTDLPIAAAVAGQESGALADAPAHSGGAVAVSDLATEAVADWASRIGARQVVTAYLPTA